jgi:acyl-CoA thioesterase FadM
MAKKEFKFSITVYLGDLNIFGTAYFANFFIWQGMAREEFFKNIIGDYQKFLKKSIKLITIQASMKYKGTAKLYDDVDIFVKPEKATLTTVDLSFTFLNKAANKIIGEGQERIGFTNLKDEIIPLPEDIISGGLDYLDDNWKIKAFKLYNNVKALNKNRETAG